MSYCYHFCESGNNGPCRDWSSRGQKLAHEWTPQGSIAVSVAVQMARWFIAMGSRGNSIDCQISNIVDAIADGVATASMKPRLLELEIEKEIPD